MKKNVRVIVFWLGLILAMIYGFTATAQDFNNSKSARLIELSVLLNDQLEASEKLSIEASEALQSWYSEDFKKSPFSYLSKKFVVFGGVTTFEVHEGDVLDAIEDIRISTVNKGGGLSEVAENSKLVGASYMTIYDDSEGKYFGTYLIVFK